MDKDMADGIARLVRVMEGISDWRANHQNENYTEVAKCPECDGRLHLIISAVNNHVWGNCETEGCVRWME